MEHVLGQPGEGLLDGHELGELSLVLWFVVEEASKKASDRWVGISQGKALHEAEHGVLATAAEGAASEVVLEDREQLGHVLDVHVRVGVRLLHLPHEGHLYREVGVGEVAV